MYQVNITAACPLCGKQKKLRKMCSSLTLIFENALNQIKGSGFDEESNICVDCQATRRKNREALMQINQKERR